jgi:sugar phosphate isomerase/epimerase
MHLKDIAKGYKPDLSGTAPDKSSVALGEGALNWAAIIGAAERGGVKHYYIEDESPDAPQQVLATKAFLAKLVYR